MHFTQETVDWIFQLPPNPWVLARDRIERVVVAWLRTAKQIQNRQGFFLPWLMDPCLNCWKPTTMQWQLCIVHSPINNFTVKGLWAVFIDSVLWKLQVLPTKSLSPRLKTVKQELPLPSALLIWAVCYRYWLVLDIPFSWLVCETLHCKPLLTHMPITVEGECTTLS